jgi:hypothetical protein
MDQIQVFDSATTSAGAGATNYNRPGTVRELREAIAERTGLLLNNFFLNFGGRMLEDDASLADTPYVTIMHRTPAANGAAAKGGRRRRRSRKSRGHRKSRRNNALVGGRRRRGSRKHRKGSRKH